MRALLIGGPAHLTEIDIPDDQPRVLKHAELRDPTPSDLYPGGHVRVHYYEEHPAIYHPRTGAKLRRVFVWDER